MRQTRRMKGSSARDGVRRVVYESYLKKLGWHFVPCMTIGSGCKVHLKKSELPAGRIICRLSKHMAAVIDGVLYDTYDCSREETRCVYGYFTKKIKTEPTREELLTRIAYLKSLLDQ